MHRELVYVSVKERTNENNLFIYKNAVFSQSATKLFLTVCQQNTVSIRRIRSFILNTMSYFVLSIQLSVENRCSRPGKNE